MKTIEKNYYILYIIYNKSIIINIIIKKMFPKFLGPIYNNKKKLNND